MRSVLSEGPAGATVRPLAGGPLVIASHNQGKVSELRHLFAPFGVATVSAAELGLEQPEETGSSFAANAEIKACVAAAVAALPALADDSGLVVPVLDGDPGVRSARWAGAEGDFATAMARVHAALVEKAAWPAPPRASFQAVLALAWPDGACAHFEGRVAGTLTWPPRGARGFGYDPMFVPDGHTATFGEMAPSEKHRISHRARAFQRLSIACFGR